MTLMKCINCAWVGVEANGRFCPVCGDLVAVADIAVEKEVVPEPEEPKVDLDVNGDGDVDDDDISVMAKTLGKRRGRPKKG